MSAPGPSIAVVIPTLDEASRLPLLLDDLRAFRATIEVVVADGGSTDGTVELAESRGCRVVLSRPGRGRQLSAGVAAARGDWLLVLHADIRFGPDAVREAEAALEDPRFTYGAWPLRIAADGFTLRIIEIGAALRWRLLGLAYGDQGLLLRRSLYEAAGGFGDFPIMEDVALARQLRRLASGRRFRAPILADARRWRREGAIRGTLRNATLLALFLLGTPPERLARWYIPQRSGGR